MTSAVPVALPPLPYDEWRAAKDTLHVWSQIVGKVKLASTHALYHWWNVPLYPDVRALTTRPSSVGGKVFDRSFDFVDPVVPR